jgi:hypothetical protein
LVKGVTTMITLEDDRLVFRFPEVHEDAKCGIHFQRTLRIPDDGKNYPLPPGFGAFPLRHLDDFARNLPAPWLKRGGVLMPMHQSEAMWICFDDGWRGDTYPFAVKIATGKINAVSGESWTNHLNADPQDYVVIPKQPWVDGYCIEKGVIRQFVAMPLGDGYSVEEQITGAAEHGGLQIVVYPMKAERYERIRRERADIAESIGRLCLAELDMGLAPGGRMKQEIYDDPYGLDAWDQRHSSRCFITIANAVVWTAITGERPPFTPPTAANYSGAKLPWFDYYGADVKALAGSPVLAKLKSVLTMGRIKGTRPLPENESAETERIINLRRTRGAEVREVSFDESVATLSSSEE